MSSELIRELVDSGIHFGHRVSRWNPKMEPYIFGKRNLIHILDLRETVKGLLRAKRFIARTVAEAVGLTGGGGASESGHAATSTLGPVLAGLVAVPALLLGCTLNVLVRGCYARCARCARCCHA